MLLRWLDRCLLSRLSKLEHHFLLILHEWIVSLYRSLVHLWYDFLWRIRSLANCREGRGSYSSCKRWNLLKRILGLVRRRVYRLCYCERALNLTRWWITWSLVQERVCILDRLCQKRVERLFNFLIDLRLLFLYTTLVLDRKRLRLLPYRLYILSRGRIYFRSFFCNWLFYSWLNLRNFLNFFSSQ